MPDYTELVTQLRSFAESDGDERCDACKYEEDYPPCVSCINRMVSDAADAIQSLSKRERFLRGKIADALDALDCGADNDWARKALEEAEKEADNG